MIVSYLSFPVFPVFLHGKTHFSQAMVIPWWHGASLMTSSALGLQLYHQLLRHGHVLSQLRHAHARHGCLPTSSASSPQRYWHFWGKKWIKYDKMVKKHVETDWTSIQHSSLGYWNLGLQYFSNMMKHVDKNGNLQSSHPTDTDALQVLQAWLQAWAASAEAMPWPKPSLKASDKESLWLVPWEFGRATSATSILQPECKVNWETGLFPPAVSRYVKLWRGTTLHWRRS